MKSPPEIREIRTLTAQNFSAGAFISFGAEAYDTDGFHDLSLNTTRLTVPPGLGIRKVKVAAAIRVSSISAGSDNVVSIAKNGSYAWYGNPGCCFSARTEPTGCLIFTEN